MTESDKRAVFMLANQLFDQFNKGEISETEAQDRLVAAFPHLRGSEIKAAIQSAREDEEAENSFMLYCLSVAERGGIRNDEKIGDVIKRMAEAGDPEAKSLYEGKAGNFVWPPPRPNFTRH
jgi:hypothetical protein